MDNYKLILHHFSPSEFGPTDFRSEDWFPQMDPSLLVRGDVFRTLWGAPVAISGAKRALGRHNGAKGSKSDHNVDRRGSVQGMDVFPEGLETKRDAERALECAKTAGLCSIGLYPEWNGGVGLHLGVREGSGGSKPLAMWGAVQDQKGQAYVSWEEALERLPD